MRVSLEFLYHFCCDRCSRWFSRADIEPQIGEKLYCPSCGHLNKVEIVQTFTQSAKSSCLQVTPDSTAN